MQDLTLDLFTEEGMLDWPHYTRPEIFEGKRVPNVLLSGDHGKIELWRKEQAVSRSKLWRKTDERT